MYCRHCGQQNINDAKYCKSCGKQISDVNQNIEHDKPTDGNNDKINQETSSPQLEKSIHIKESHKSYMDRMFSGRINRKNYFLGYIFVYILLLIINILLYFLYELFVSENVNSEYEDILYLLNIVYLLFFWASIGIRRAHDLNKNGVYILLLFIPIANIIASITLLFGEGDKDTNKFGKPPIDSFSLNHIFTGKP